MKAQFPFAGSNVLLSLVSAWALISALGLAGCSSVTKGSGTPPPPASPTVGISASPASIAAGGSATLTITAANATQVTVSGSDGSSYNLAATGGTQAVNPKATATYTATAVGASGTTNATASATLTVTAVAAAPTVTITASPTTIVAKASSTLTVTATNATQVTVAGSDGSSYTLAATGGTQAVSPAATTTYTATAAGAAGTANATAQATVTVTTTQPGLQSINHVVFMLQENHTFDNYFGMLNPYRIANNWTTDDEGTTYQVDGIDDKLATISNVNDEKQAFPLFKLKSACVDDESSAWLESYGDVNRYNFQDTRPILMDGFVHNAEGFAKSCIAYNRCAGAFTDTAGQRAMGYYDQDFLNYYYYMAAQFAVSDRWFSPVSAKSTPNRVATFTGGTTQGLVLDPGSDDHLGKRDIPSIFQELDTAGVSWKLYYTVTQGNCLDPDECTGGPANYPATTLRLSDLLSEVLLFESDTRDMYAAYAAVERGG